MSVINATFELLFKVQLLKFNAFQLVLFIKITHQLRTNNKCIDSEKMLPKMIKNKLLETYFTILNFFCVLQLVIVTHYDIKKN